MCSLTGFYDTTCQTARDKLAATITKMVDTLRHRGPDTTGIWVDEKTGIALGHRRLSITAPSPMHSASGRFMAVFDGRIYNFRELMQELALHGHGFRTHSETEVLLASIEQWGLEQAVKRLIGMFAFVLWDREKHVLHLVRDRLGIKPLYYGWMGKTFLFGSGLNALRIHPDFHGRISRDALALYLRYNYIPAPYSIYHGVYKLPPGTLLVLKDAVTVPDPVPTPYWSVRKAAEYGIASTFTGTTDEAIEHLEDILKDVVKLHMATDVPAGAFLSGGIDSSMIVALMQAQTGRPVKTFSIGFNEQDYDETKHAEAVAKHLGTEHNELYVTPEQALAVISKLPVLYDEPFSDPSQIPTFLLCELARRNVVVSLSGDGADEFFGGYNQYFWCRSIWQKTGWIPRKLRDLSANTLRILSPQTWNAVFRKIGPVLPKKLIKRNPGDRLHKLAVILAADNPVAMYHSLISLWQNPMDIAIGAGELPTAFTDRNLLADLPDYTRQIMYLDAVTYLPNGILTKIDRAGKGAGLEIRVPFLDHRVVEFTWRVPLSMLIRNGQGKWLLRQVLYKYLPGELVDRPKMGFGAPISRWFKGPLKDWADSQLDGERLKQEGFLRQEPVLKLWKEHLGGERNWQYQLWNILMFQAWLEKEKTNHVTLRA